MQETEYRIWMSNHIPTYSKLRSYVNMSKRSAIYMLYNKPGVNDTYTILC